MWIGVLLARRDIVMRYTCVDAPCGVLAGVYSFCTCIFIESASRPKSKKITQVIKSQNNEMNTARSYSITERGSHYLTSFNNYP